MQPNMNPEPSQTPAADKQAVAPTSMPRRRRSDAHRPAVPSANRHAAPPAPQMMRINQARPASTPVPIKKARPRMPLGILIAVLLSIVLLAGLAVAQTSLVGYIETQLTLQQAAYDQMVAKHPLHYRELIQQEAEKNNLQPAFLASIILNESSFRRDAVSSVDARGLMQVMPGTAKDIARELDMGDDFSIERLFDPETNIRFGSYYIGKLAVRFRGDPVLIAAAYHSGAMNVTNWLNDSQYSKDGITIALDDMMDGPSKNYARKVANAYGIYQRLYFQENPEIPQ